MLRADLAPYAEDFESYNVAAPGGLLGSGWLVYGNAFSSSGGYLYGYGPFDAPNAGGAFCNIATGEGGAAQGTKVLTVYSDYNNSRMAAPTSEVIEGNTFREMFVGARDLGSTWTFQFDVKKGNLLAPSTNMAFIKVLDPAAGYATSYFVVFDVATLADTNWATHSLQVTIDPSWTGRLLQIGFLATATEYRASGAFYDNLSFTSPDYVKPPGPKIVSIEKVGDDFFLTVETKVGFDYTFRRAESPAGPYGDPIETFTGDGSPYEFIDYDPGLPRAFYIVEETASP